MMTNNVKLCERTDDAAVAITWHGMAFHRVYHLQFTQSLGAKPRQLVS